LPAKRKRPGKRQAFRASVAKTCSCLLLRHDQADSAAGGSLGYNLRNRTRIAVNYEYARRRSVEIVSRNYDRRRIFLSWSFTF